MNRHYTPLPRRTRALLAAASALLSTVVLASIVGLAEHYSEQVPLAQAETNVAEA